VLLRWFRRRQFKTKLLIVLIVVASFMGCFGLLTPPSAVPRLAPTPSPAAAPRQSAAPFILPDSAAPRLRG
jgi:hypothetical protein